MVSSDKKDADSHEAGSPPKSSRGGAGSGAPQGVPGGKEQPLKNPSRKLGEILVEAGIVTEGQLVEGLAKKAQEGGFLGQALVELKYVDQATLSSFLVKQCKIPHLNLLDYQIDKDIVSLLPKDLCTMYSLLPLDKLGKILTVAMVDPLDMEALDAVRRACPNLRIKPILCDWRHFTAVLLKLFPEEGIKQEVTVFTLGTEGSSSAKTKAKAPPVERAVAADQASAHSPVDDPGDVPEVIPEVALEDAVSSAPVSHEGAPAALAGLSGVGFEELAAFFLKAVKEVVSTTVTETLAVARDQGSGSQSSDLDEKMGALAGAVAEIAQASDTLRTARDVERASVAVSNRRDLERGGAEQETRWVTDVRCVGREAEPLGGETAADVPDSSVPQSGYTFDRFVPGETNDFTFTLCRAVSENPGGEYNPFFLCGGVGLGKTHLVNAIGNAIVAQDPGRRVGYASSGLFSGHLTEALENRSVEAFRDAVQRWDVLVLDDIQFLGGQIEAQEEFFHLFNVLHQQGRQIIIAADKPPEKLGLLEQRLVSRFTGGIVAQLKPPEKDALAVILRHQADEANIAVGDDVLSLIAARVSNDVRKLMGCFRKIVAFARLKSEDVSCELADVILTELGIGDAA